MAASSRKSTFWTRSSFIWSTIFFGIVAWRAGIILIIVIIVIILLYCYYCTHCVIDAVIVLIAIILLIDIIAIIVLIAFFWQICTDLSIPDTIWLDKRAAIAKLLKIWEISSVLPCERDGWLSLGRPILPMLMSMKLQWDRVNRSCLTIWGPGLVCTINTNPSCSFVFSNNYNKCSNNHNNSQ